MPLDASNARDLPTRALSERAGRGVRRVEARRDVGVGVGSEVGSEVGRGARVHEALGAGASAGDHRNGDVPTGDARRADRLFADWARLGVGFAAAPSATTPDVERLIIDTIRHGRNHARLLVMAATWLRVYGSLVARHRLAQLALTELGETERSILGWLLDESVCSPATIYGLDPDASNASAGGERGKRAVGALRSGVRFREVTAVCRPAARTQPVFRVHERHAALHERLDRAASPSARRWNLLAEALEPKFDSLRAPSWLLGANPSLSLRALLGGDLRASILAAIERDEAAGASELELARRCGASRAAVRDALARLSLAGVIERSTVGRRKPIRLVHAA